MKLPRDVDGERLIKSLAVLGYQATRQTSSHIRVTTQQNGENHEVVLATVPSRPGLLPAYSSTSLPITS
jgi:predicted RNA binding protein YcfA (HicA-like mRNA interferase family)